MKAIRLSFIQMLRFVRSDKMLFVSCFVPLLAGLFFKFALPAIKIEAVRPYYGMIDLFYSALAPTMFCFAAAMVILEEHDDHIGNYLFITPLGKEGYLISRICIPAIAAFAMTLVLLPIFKLTDLSFAELFFVSVTGALQGAIIGLLIVTLSTNKLEGMAVTKLSTLTILGVSVPYLIPGRLQFVVFFLPSFWIGKAVCDHRIIYVIPSVLTAFVWITLLMKKFMKKIS